MRLYGIIGYPIAHSRSPEYFNELFRREGLDARYLPFELEDIAEQIQAKCTIHSSDVLAVLRCLQETVIEGLRDGKSVRLGDLGCFRPTVSSEGFDTPDEVTAKAIKRVKVTFYANRKIFEAIKVSNPAVKFRSVLEAAADNTTENEDASGQ